MNSIKLLFAGAALFCTIQANSTVCTAVVNGDWSAAETWDCGHSPGNNDTMWIPIGITVYVDINSPEYQNMLVIVDGSLYFEVGQKINMCPGGVYVSSTGVLDGGNPGSKIDVCGTTLWNGPGPTYGPSTYGDVNLPAEIVDFDGAVHILGDVDLGWSTGTDINASQFIVERSTNGITYIAIGSVMKKKGHATESYTYTDTAAPKGTVYYRIIVVDNMGRQESVAEKVIQVEGAENADNCELTVYPNPCQGQCTVNFSACPEDNDGTITLEMIDANGRVVSQDIPQRSAEGGFNTSLEATNNLAPGVYIVRGVSSKQVYSQKAVIK